MPDKPIAVITYAASASLAAAALVYFFNPNYLIDGDSSGASASTRKKGVVGLSNPANDCFINSVLQSLAGLRELRLYLIRELHRRKLDSSDVYKALPERGKDGKPIDARKTLSLQSGEVTQGLKDVLDSLNERPIYKKTISAAGFIAVLEHAFGTRISKSQQDAQELLQIVAERISDEYHAGREARRRARAALGDMHPMANPRAVTGLGLSETGAGVRTGLPQRRPISADKDSLQSAESVAAEEEAGFPLEGRTESQIECQHCHFTPKASPTSFVMLTLPVPQKSSATLNECFDSHFKTEYIDDYMCDVCRLEHATTTFEKDLSRARTEKDRRSIETKIAKVKEALAKDPETPPKDVELPNSKLAPKRKIARHVRITDFPNILVVHLSRSIFDPRSSSTKNTAKVSFPERLPLGGLVHRRQYKLLGVVSHKGTHNSGHYETFRRQNVYPPTSTPHVDHETGPYSRSNTPTPSTLSSPRMSGQSGPSGLVHGSISEIASSPSPSRLSSPLASEAALNTPAATASPTTSSSSLGSVPASSSAASTLPSSHSDYANGNGNGITPKRGDDSFTSAPRGSASEKQPQKLPTSNINNINNDDDGDDGTSGAKRKDSATTSSITPTPTTTNTAAATATKKAEAAAATAKTPNGRVKPPHQSHRGRRKPHSDRWWRISDDKIKECKTADVLAMQKEVYILFYEIDKE